jgi:hypothetical protein
MAKKSTTPKVTPGKKPTAKPPTAAAALPYDKEKMALNRASIVLHRRPFTTTYLFLQEVFIFLKETTVWFTTHKVTLTLVCFMSF